MSSEYDHDAQRPGVHEQASELDSARTAPEADTTEAPEAVRAARAAVHPGTDWPAMAGVRGARGFEWVRPTDLIVRHGASLAGRGIDLEVELARRARTPITAGVRQLADRARRLPPLSAFGRGTSPALRRGPAWG